MPTTETRLSKEGEYRFALLLSDGSITVFSKNAQNRDMAMELHAANARIIDPAAAPQFVRIEIKLHEDLGPQPLKTSLTQSSEARGTSADNTSAAREAAVLEWANLLLEPQAVRRLIRLQEAGTHGSSLENVVQTLLLTGIRDAIGKGCIALQTNDAAPDPLGS